MNRRVDAPLTPAPVEITPADGPGGPPRAVPEAECTRFEQSCLEAAHRTQLLLARY